MGMFDRILPWCIRWEAAMRWIVTWTLVKPVGIEDGYKSFVHWYAVLEYIQDIVPEDATFTVRPA